MTIHRIIVTIIQRDEYNTIKLNITSDDVHDDDDDDDDEIFMFPIND